MVRKFSKRLRQLVSGETDPEALQAALVDELKSRHLINSAHVEAAFRAVPRHLFLPGTPLDQVYRDDVVVTRYNENSQAISSSSQPAIMALMLEMLDLQPGQRVLEIGAGTGFNAALIGHIVGPTGTVTSIDIDQEIVDEARERLESAEISNVQVSQGDGALGWPEHAPYDRIILSVGAFDIYSAWHEQLTEGGCLVLPLTLRCAPRVYSFLRAEDALISREITPGGFMPLRGLGTPQEYIHPFAEGLSIWTDGQVEVDLPGLAETFRATPRVFRTHVEADSISFWSAWSLWLELYDPAFALVYARTQDPSNTQLITGLAQGREAALVRTPPDWDAQSGRGRPFELYVQCLGESDTLAQRLIHQLQQWKAAGSPPLEDDLHVRAYPVDSVIDIQPGSKQIVKTHRQYVVDISSTSA